MAVTDYGSDSDYEVEVEGAQEEEEEVNTAAVEALQVPDCRRPPVWQRG